MPASRVLPTQEATDLVALVRDLARNELAPRVAEAEENARFPRDVFATLGKAGVLGLPYPEEYGGGGQPYEVYLQVLEELGSVWVSVGVGTSVHALSCFGLVMKGTEEQKRKFLPDMLGGDLAVIKAQVPLSEVANYQNQLKSVTGGQGSYSMELSHYDPVPPHVQQQIVAAWKPKVEED